MRLSARNILKGKIVDAVKVETTAHVRIDIGGAVVTASITNEAVDELGLKRGMAASAVIKSSDVMVAVDRFKNIHSGGRLGADCICSERTRRGHGLV